MQPENILLADKAAPDGGIAVKVIDFGLSNMYEAGSTLKTACGSPAYASPEMIARVAGGYNPRKSDRKYHYSITYRVNSYCLVQCGRWGWSYLPW